MTEAMPKMTPTMESMARRGLTRSERAAVLNISLKLNQ